MTLRKRFASMYFYLFHKFFYHIQLTNKSNIYNNITIFFLISTFTFIHFFRFLLYKTYNVQCTLIMIIHNNNCLER